ncbi:hypothetical protein AAEX28_01305 [Lentisphaerota bacterium WC36G]|nr:hypothetical protein LJT99_04190 [Lentisphaerae bacterium WC36]
MKKLLLSLGSFATILGNVYADYEIGNKFVTRIIDDGEKLHTVKIINHEANKEIIPTKSAEFSIRVSKGTHVENTDKVLTADDFKVLNVKKYQKSDAKGIKFELFNKEYQLKVTVFYEVNKDAKFMYKYLQITPQKSIVIEKVDIESLNIADAYQPYKIKRITAQAPWKWSPGLGQPVFTKDSATFWGVEFPASNNTVSDDKTLACGYLWGREVKANTTYKTYKAVVGVADNDKYSSDAFYEYIEKIRARPLRLQTQYNTWFNGGPRTSKGKFAKSIKKINNELCVTRGNSPLKAYVIDDGWQDTSKDWSKDIVWPVNTKKFDSDFHTSLNNAHRVHSSLGLWLSPGCIFGGQRAIPKLKAAGYESIAPWMSMAGPKYMSALEKRMVQLASSGIDYFKLDGVFGHLNTRNFEVDGQKYGLPSMPQILPKGIKGNSKELNDAKYDELKTYYLVAGTERLMEIFSKMDEVNPNIYIVISNGAYLSSWWMMYVDSVWMINAGDAAGGSSRTQELVYRDGVYYEIWNKKKLIIQFHRYLIMNQRKLELEKPKKHLENIYT